MSSSNFTETVTFHLSCDLYESLTQFTELEGLSIDKYIINLIRHDLRRRIQDECLKHGRS